MTTPSAHMSEVEQRDCASSMNSGGKYQGAAFPTAPFSSSKLRLKLVSTAPRTGWKRILVK
ncbi:hypothetical protein RRF57_010757 [Xylaria bambusicola]|uniref:Uncharacterized protein n=1 Tax=Xylaria bambusicola TaxID=326684 RepID=A0AAN7Z315_9PEZI